MRFEDHSVSVSELGGGIVLVEATGEIDASSAPNLQRELLSALAEGADGLVLDLAGVTYMDSSGVGAVVAAYAEATEKGARLVVVCGDGHAAKRIRVMGLDAVLRMAGSREEALNRVTAS